MQPPADRLLVFKIVALCMSKYEKVSWDNRGCRAPVPGFSEAIEPSLAVGAVLLSGLDQGVDEK